MIWLKLNGFSKNEELTYWNTDSNSIENGLSADYRLENASNLGVYQTIESYNFYNDIHAYWTMNQPLLSLENENYFFTTDKTELALNTEEFEQLYSKLNFKGFSGIARVTAWKP